VPSDWFSHCAANDKLIELHKHYHHM